MRIVKYRSRVKVAKAKTPKKIGEAESSRTSSEYKIMAQLYPKASTPPASKILNWLSFSVRTPSSCAFANFEPAASPATRKSVFFDTDEELFPPWSTITSATPSRVKSTSDPVTTRVSPVRVCGSVDWRGASTNLTPADSHLEIISWCHPMPNHSITDCAIT